MPIPQAVQMHHYLVQSRLEQQQVYLDQTWMLLRIKPTLENNQKRQRHYLEELTLLSQLQLTLSHHFLEEILRQKNKVLHQILKVHLHNKSEHHLLVGYSVIQIRHQQLVPLLQLPLLLLNHPKHQLRLPQTPRVFLEEVNHNKTLQNNLIRRLLSLELPQQVITNQLSQVNFRKELLMLSH